jgi:glutathione S-transferase
MKLHQTYLSPFPTRVRLLVLAKGLDVEMVEPPGFHGDPRPKGDYLELNPIGRVPALELPDGTVIPESEVICEYLEDAFPEPSLRPRDPVDLARVRLLSRISDFYVVMAMAPLFDMVALPPKQWDQPRIRRALAEIAAALGHVEAYIGGEGYAVGKSLTQADGVLLPILLLVDEWLPIFRPEAPLLDALPKTRAYWRLLARDPIAARLIEETRTALRRSMQRG